MPTDVVEFPVVVSGAGFAVREFVLAADWMQSWYQDYMLAIFQIEQRKITYTNLKNENFLRSA